MLTLRQRVGIIVGLVLIIFFGVLLYIWYGRDKAAEIKENQENTNINIQSTGVEINTGNNQAQETVTLPEYSEDIYLKQLAVIFVERFATYSTQNPNQNITDSLALASDSMQTWMKNQSKEPTLDYEGTTTDVLATQVTEKNTTAATVTIEAQQTFEQKKDGATGANTKEIRQKSGRVTFVKVAGEWKVDGLYWNP